MYHDAICACFEIGLATLYRVVHALIKNETFAACKDHELISYLGILTGLNFSAEIIDGVLCLRHIVTKQRILF